MNKKPDQQVQRRISHVNWNQVYTFSLVATHGSLKNASEILDLSPSTLSEQVSQLEASLDTQLFHRKGPKLTITESGKKLFHMAKQMFENGQRILDIVSPLNLGCYPVSIGVVPGPHLFSTHRLICDYVERRGQIDLKITQWSFEELESRLLDRLDLGFADQPSKRKDIVSKKVCSSQIRFFVSEQWRDHSLREVLKRIPLLICQSEAATDAFLEKALEGVDIFPCAVMRAEYPSVLLDLCRRGLGVGAFSDDGLDAWNRDSMRLMQNPKDAPKIESHTYALWSVEAENTMAVAEFQRQMQEV